MYMRNIAFLNSMPTHLCGFTVAVMDSSTDLLSRLKVKSTFLSLVTTGKLKHTRPHYMLPASPLPATTHVLFLTFSVAVTA